MRRTREERIHARVVEDGDQLRAVSRVGIRRVRSRAARRGYDDIGVRGREGNVELSCSRIGFYGHCGLLLCILFGLPFWFGGDGRN